MPKTLLDYAKADYLCSCGKRHRTDLRSLLIAPDAGFQLAELLRTPSFGDIKSVQLVADENTWQAAGEQVAARLGEAGIRFRQIVFPGTPALVADERAAFAILNALDDEVGLLAAIGTGTLNDLTRFVSSRAGRPYVIVATAPSMDGYASTVAAMTIANMKQTVPGQGAQAIIADPAVLAACPQAMSAAGLGDILGKYSAVCDWRLGRMVEGEYYCDEIANLISDTTASCHAQAGNSSPEAASELFSALIMTGIAMSYAGNSRPASGSEHHLSHFWEMAFLRQNKPAVLHGSKVGLATIITLALYHHLTGLKPDFAAARAQVRPFDREAFAKKMRQVFADGADPIIALGLGSGAHDPERILDHVDRLESGWTELQALIRASVPAPEAVRDALEKAGGATRPETLGIGMDLIEDSLRYACEMRDRYTVLRLYADLGLTDEAIRLVAELFG